jgi:hypothetical protein
MVKDLTLFILVKSSEADALFSSSRIKALVNTTKLNQKTTIYKCLNLQITTSPK